MKKKSYRILLYILGLVILALGLTLNTKAGLGVSPIISIAYSGSIILNFRFADATLILYCIFVIVEIILHLYKKRNKSILLLDILQIPLSVIFTRFMNIFVALIPDFATEYKGSFLGSLQGRIIILILAIIFTGIGAALSLNMRIVPNPGDGIVQAISDSIGKSVGFTKNCFDCFNLLITIVISLGFYGKLLGVGIGTIMAMIGVGRTIAAFNYFFRTEMLRKAGIAS